MSKQIPIGWSESALGLVSNIVMGQSPSSDTYNDDRIGLPFFQGKTDFGSRSPKVRVWCSKPTKVAEKDSILFSVRAPVGDINVANRKSCIGRGLAAITGTTVNQNYLYQQITLAKTSFQLVAQGSTFEAISGSELRDFKLIIPPLQEQQKIAAILTSVDEVVEKTQAQIDKLKDLKSGMMQELLTKGVGIKQGDKYEPHTEFKDSPVGKIPKIWEALPLSMVAKLERGKFSHRPRNDPEFYNGKIPFLQTGDIPKTTPYIENFSQTLNEKGLGVSKLFPIGTLVITIAATIGEIGLLQFDSCFPDSLVGITVNSKKADSIYILYVMKYLKNELELLAPQTAQKNINLDILNPFVIPVPPLLEQKQISASLKSVDERLKMLEQKLSKIQNTKKALMQDLLTGKVRVKVDNDLVS